MASSSSIGTLLRQGAPFAALGAALRQRDRLLAEVRALLPAELRAHCVGATREGERLTLTTEASVWAARLRFAVPPLLAAYAQRGAPLTKVQVRVLPPTPLRAAGAELTPEAAPRARLTVPGPAVTDQLEALAAGQPDDPLAASLARLAQTLRAAQRARAAGGGA